MDEGAWGALALTLTLLGGIYTWVAWTRRGLAAALRGAGLTLLPVAALLTGVLEMLTEIGGAVGDWAVELALSPSLWIGVGLAGVSAVLFVVAGFMHDKVGTSPRPPRAKGVEAPGKPAELAVGQAPKGASAIDDEMAEIEAILRKRGIT